MTRNAKLIISVIVGVILIAGILLLAKSKKSEPSLLHPVSSSASEKIESAVRPADSSVVSKATATPDQAVEKNISAQLKSMGVCLNLKNSISDRAAPTFAEINSSLKSEFGDVVTQNEEWSNIHVQLPSGEQRRIRIEVDSNGEESSLRRLKYYGVDKEGLPVPIALPKEQTENPTDTFISGLESEGKVIMTEKAMHAYYPHGQEVLYTEKNGLVSELEISKNGKSFKCSQLASANAVCKCF
jgi:hypothetical protein